MTDQASTHISAIGTVGVPVSDPDRALTFYGGTLGFEVRLDAPFGGGMRWIEVAPPGAATTVALTPPRQNGETGGVDTGIRLSTTDADADHAELASRGV